jgi:PAS domain S-box-containing protein
MRAMIEGFDWAATPAGPRDEWPAELHTVVALMLDSPQPMVVIWGDDRTMLYNDAYAAILAEKHPSALGRPFFLVWSELVGTLRPVIDRAFAGEGTHLESVPVVLERRGYQEDAHFSLSAAPIRCLPGGVCGALCTCVEITERVRAERALEDRERQLRALASTTPDLLVRFDRDLRHLYVNAAAVRASGVPAEEMIGRTNRDLGMPRQLVDLWEEHIDRVFDAGSEEALSFSFDLDGSTRHYRARLIPEFGEDGEQVTSVLGVTHDVTEQVETSYALQSAHAQLQALVHNVPLGIYLVDHQFRLAQVNPAAMPGFLRPHESGGPGL